jgi:hypothetical protein
MDGYRDGIALRFQVQEQTRVSGGHISPLDDFRLLDKTLEFCDGEARKLALFLF